MSIDITKAAGIDGISPRILWHCASSLLTPICHLFISSITTGNIPTEWCTHCIIPIHKSGNKTLVNNYRPISLLCFCAANSDTTPTYTINGQVIDHKTHHKDLGIFFSSDLSWTKHYNHITPKAYKTLGLLRRTFKSNNTQTKKLLYITLVRSQLTYCSQLWRPHLIKDITLLERIQRRATKYILNNYKL